MGTCYPMVTDLCLMNINQKLDGILISPVALFLPKCWLMSEPAVVGYGRSLLIDDAATRLGICRRTVYYRIREGRLRTIRTRGGSQRVLVSSIEALQSDGTARRGSAAGGIASG